MNKSILLGRLTKKPEIRFSYNTNTKIALFTLAVDRKYVKEGEEKKADFINIAAYSKLADFSEKYLTQGLKVCVSGRIQTRDWEDSTGKKRYVTEIIAEEIEFADSLKKKEEIEEIVETEVESTEETEDIENAEITENVSDDDDLPF